MRVRTHQHAKFRQNRSIGCGDIKIFSFFQDGGCRHLGFLKSLNFIGYCVQKVESHQHAKFCQNRSISCEDIKIFQFFKIATVRHLGFFGAYLDHTQWVLWGLYHSAKFGYDRCSSFYNMNISIFGTFGWKIPIHAPIWAIWSPKSAAISTKAKKGTSLRESASFEPLSV